MKALCSRSTHLSGYRHNCLVGTRKRLRDWLRTTYWVVCIYCDELQGPHRQKCDAQGAADAFNERKES